MLNILGFIIALKISVMLVQCISITNGTDHAEDKAIWFHFTGHNKAVVVKIKGKTI